MNKTLQFIFLVITLFVCGYTHAQTNPYYTVTQQNVQTLYTNNFEVASVGVGNTYNPIFPAYTTFLTDGYVLENISGSKHIQGIPIGFKFPYAGHEFDIYAVNAKGYIILGKSWEGGMTVYADTLIETSTDTIFTNKNKYLISGLYAGKDMDLQGSISFQIYNGGFKGERRLLITHTNMKVVIGGSIIILGNLIELKETGEISIRSHVQILFNSTNNNLHSYGSFMQRYGSGFTDYVYTADNTADSWFHTLQSYNNTDYKSGILRDTVKPSLVTVYPYTISYRPKLSNFECPVPIRWNPNPPGGFKDSAYIANDYEELQNDTLSTTDRIWWYSDMGDSLRFDVYLGTDEISMERYKTGLIADTMVINFNYVLGLVNLPLDSLAAGQKYFIKIHTIHPSEDTTVCEGYSFYTKPDEEIKNYCRSDEPNGGLDAGFAYSVLDLNTLHFHPDTMTGQLLEYKSIVPDTGNWTTILQQGEDYQLKLGTIETSDNIQAIYFPLASIFIDYNSDGDFEDNNEFYYTTVASTHRYNDVTINVPTNAISGKTRLRVVQRNRSPYPSPCSTSEEFFGSSLIYKDFIISIVQAPGCNLFYNNIIEPPSCATYNNGGLSITPSGGTAPYQIQWNTGNPKDTLFTLSGLVSPARHRATITDAAGCNIRTAMLQLTQPTPLDIDTMLHNNPSWIAFSGGTKPYHVDITGDKTETRYAVNDTIFVTDLPAGNYNIKAMDSNGCEQQYTLSYATDPDPVQQIDFILYPNPATHYIQIAGINNSAFISLYSSDGKKVFEGNCTNQQLIQLPALASALYLVRIAENEKTKTIKLIIK